MVDILFICRDNTGGSMTGFVNAINKFTDYKADYVQALPPNELQYPQGRPLYEQETKDWLDEIIKDVQVFHWNINGPQKYLDQYNFAPHFINKVNVRHYRGTQCREIDAPFHGKLWCDHAIVSTPDLTQYHKDYKYFPNPIHIPFDIKPTMPEENVFYHSPTWRSTLGEYRKLIKRSELYPNLPDDETVKGSKKIMEVTGLPMPEKLPWKEELERKSKITCLIDQLFLGVYGTSSIEAMAMGKAVICYLSDHTIKEMREWQYFEYDTDCPIIYTDYFDIENCWRWCKDMDLSEYAKRCKEFAEKFHDPKLIAERYVEMMIG